MNTLSARQHQGIAIGAVVALFALAGANYAKHGTSATQYTAAAAMPEPPAATDTAMTSPVMTDTSVVPAVTCDTLMADLEQGRPTGVELSGGTTRTFLDPSGNLAETLVRSEILEHFWPGRRLLLLNMQWKDGSRAALSSALIGCNSDRLTLLESGDGPAALEGGLVRIDELLSTSGDAADRGRIRRSRFLSVGDGVLRESEPVLQLSEHARIVADSGINTFGSEHGLTTVAAIASMTGRYRLVPETASPGIAEREIVLRPDGLLLSRHSADDIAPFVAGSFDWAQWYAVRDPATAPANSATVHVEFVGRPELVMTWEGDRLTVGTTAYLRDQPQTPRLWRHSAGEFQTLGGGWWYEISPDSKFSFVEQSRTADAVELFDPSRNCYVRLSGSDASVRCAADLQWRPFYTGGWIT